MNWSIESVIQVLVGASFFGLVVAISVVHVTNAVYGFGTHLILFGLTFLFKLILDWLHDLFIYIFTSLKLNNSHMNCSKKRVIIVLVRVWLLILAAAISVLFVAIGYSQNDIWAVLIDFVLFFSLLRILYCLRFTFYDRQNKLTKLFGDFVGIVRL